MTNRMLYPWLLVAMLCIVGCLNYLDRMMIVTMRSSIVDEIPMSDAQFGLLTSVFLWVYGFSSPLAGYIADRFRRSKVIIASLFIWSIVTWLTSRASNFEQLLTARALMGLSEAFYIPAAMALIMDWHSERTKSTAVGIHVAGVTVGQSLGFLGAWIAESHTWHYAFSLFGVIGVCYAVIVLFFLKDKNKLPSSQKKEDSYSNDSISFRDALLSLFKNTAFLWVLVIWGLAGAVSWMVNSWLPTYYKETFGLSQTEAGLYSTAYFFPAVLFGVILGGALADRWSKIQSRARMWVPAIGFLIAVPGVFIASYTVTLWATVAGFLVYAVTRPFIDANMMPILGMITDKRYLATGYGFLNLFSCIIGGIGIYVAGILRDEQVKLSLVFQVAALTMVVCALLLFRLKANSDK
ncbi:MFS transporter [Sphingobacterium multivorum]|uniref:Sugar phosphate permease n=1 Tax=Sphingobacterium multivorum TaxID=28454 RepID=A0A654BCG6_SPHMU|nr:MFS transporter [Sphingobacterium multivorum]VXC77864.1 Sugar phosphate permease [Sphingobacterium multivorum]